MVQNIGLVDAAIVVGYMVACLMAGVIKARQIKSIKDYAVGDRNFSTLVLVSTLFATFVSASRIGEVSAIYTYGVIFAVPFFFMPLNWLLVTYIYDRNIWNTTYNLIQIKTVYFSSSEAGVLGFVPLRMINE